MANKLKKMNKLFKYIIENGQLKLVMKAYRQ